MAEPNGDFLSYLAAISSAGKGFDTIADGLVKQINRDILKDELDSMLMQAQTPRVMNPLNPEDVARYMSTDSAPRYSYGGGDRSGYPSDTLRSMSDFGHPDMPAPGAEILDNIANRFMETRAVGPQAAEDNRTMNNLVDRFMTNKATSSQASPVEAGAPALPQEQYSE